DRQAAGVRHAQLLLLKGGRPPPWYVPPQTDTSAGWQAIDVDRHSARPPCRSHAIAIARYVRRRQHGDANGRRYAIHVTCGRYAIYETIPWPSVNHFAGTCLPLSRRFQEFTGRGSATVSAGRVEAAIAGARRAG